MRLLICDDHVLLAEALAVRFRARGHDVTVVDGPRLAIVHVARHQPDLCLMDLRFPNAPLGGLQAIAGLRRASPQTVVLMISAAMDDWTAHAAVRAGAHGVVRKSTSLAGLERSVEQARAGRVILPCDLANGAARGKLAPKEIQVLELVAEGLSTVQISERLHLAVSTVRSYLQSASTKLGAPNRLTAAHLVGSTAQAGSRSHASG